MTQSNLNLLVWAILVNLTICFFTILIRQWAVDENIPLVLIAQSIGILSLLGVHTYVWIKIGGNDLSLAFIFLLMVFVFNLGKSILFIFYHEHSNNFFTFFTAADSQVVVRAFEYGYVGFLVLSSAMLLGFQHRHVIIIEPSSQQLNAAKFTGILFLTVSLPSALFDLQQMILLVLSGGYFALFNSEQTYGAAGILKVLAFFLYPSLFLLVVAYKSNQLILKSIFVFALSLALIKLMLGMRLTSLIPFMVFISLWDSVIKPINRKAIYLVAIFLFVFVFPMMSFLRTGQEITEAAEKTSALYRIVAEMSDSISPLVWVMQRVPSQFDFTYGNSLFLALYTAVPNLFWDVHPAKTGSLALWLVNEVNPWIAERGGGYGFSIFAEMYINFYWFGMFFLFIFGFFISKLALIKQNPINTAFAFSCFLGFMLWPRGELVSVARFIFWHVGFLWICYHIMTLIYIRLK
jgi:oligosaccharide repeat unit polymerase